MSTAEMDQPASLPARRAATAPADDPLMDVVPPPGRALLACHCGRVLDATDMHRQRSRHPGAPPIPRITCKDCAT